MSNPINDWIDARIKAAVDEAMKNARDAIIAEMQAMENNILAQISLLPGLLGSQIENVAMDAGAVAAKIVSAVNGQLAGFPQQVVSGVSSQLASLPQQIIQGVLQGLPGLGGIHLFQKREEDR